MKEIQLAHGGGGEEMSELIGKIFSSLDNEILRQANDAALLDDLALSTDSFTLSPLFWMIM